MFRMGWSAAQGIKAEVSTMQNAWALNSSVPRVPELLFFSQDSIWYLSAKDSQLHYRGVLKGFC